jgi:hypothetical protein
MSYTHPRAALGATPKSKSSRYALMGLASVGVVGYYLSHKNPWVAGLYSVIAVGYFATAKDYEEEAKTVAPPKAILIPEISS